MNRDPLGEVYRRLQAPGSPACPAPERLADLVLGQVSGEERERLADHVVACRRCSEDARILLETHREARGELGAEAVPGRRRWFALAAAAVLAVAALGILLLRQVPEIESAERGSAPRAAGLTPPDAAALNEPPAHFAWPATAGAEGYRLKLFRDSGDILWESDRFGATQIELPPDRRALLERGRSYFWVVEVEGSLERTRLGPFTFRVEESPKR